MPAGSRDALFAFPLGDVIIYQIFTEYNIYRGQRPTQKLSNRAKFLVSPHPQFWEYWADVTRFRKLPFLCVFKGFGEFNGYGKLEYLMDTVKLIGRMRASIA